MALNPLPPIEVLKADYYRMGSVKKAARHHHVTDYRVRTALQDAGVSMKIKDHPAKVEGHQCVTCAGCTPLRCEYINAPIEDMEAALKQIGAKYNKVLHGYFVKKCPQHEQGDVGSLTVNADLSSFQSNVGTGVRQVVSMSTSVKRK